MRTRPSKVFGTKLRFLWKQKLGAPVLQTIANQISGGNAYWQSLTMISLGRLYEQHLDNPYWRKIFEEEIFPKGQNIMLSMAANRDIEASNYHDANALLLFVGDSTKSIQYVLLYDVENRQLMQLFEFSEKVEIITPVLHSSILGRESSMQNTVIAINMQKNALEAYRIISGQLTPVASKSFPKAPYKGRWDISTSTVTAVTLPNGSVSLGVGLRSELQRDTRFWQGYFILNGQEFISISENSVWHLPSEFSWDMRTFSPTGEHILSIEYEFDGPTFLGYSFVLWKINDHHPQMVGKLLCRADSGCPRIQRYRPTTVQWISDSIVRIGMGPVRDNYLTQEEYDSANEAGPVWQADVQFPRDGFQDSVQGISIVDNKIDNNKLSSPLEEKEIKNLQLSQYSFGSWFNGVIRSFIDPTVLAAHYLTAPSGAKSGLGYYNGIEIFRKHTEFNGIGLIVAKWIHEKNFLQPDCEAIGIDPKLINFFTSGIAILGAFDATIVAPQR